MGRVRPILLAAALLSLVLGGAVPASAATGATCSGTLASPGLVASGTYDSLTINGACVTQPNAQITVNGPLVVSPGSTFIANLPAIVGAENDAVLTVNGNVMVQAGAAMLLGCAPSIGCANTTTDVVSGDLVADHALGVLVHGDTIRGNVVQTGGGGGVSCGPNASWFLNPFGVPVYSAYEDSVFGGNVTLTAVRSCWLGVNRAQIGGNLVVVNDNLADPDAIEILSNHVAGNLVCQQDSMTWDSGDATEGLFPRISFPNTVDGQRVGQCVTASATTDANTFPGVPF